MLLFHTRTFSNTIESITFAFSAFIALRAMAPQVPPKTHRLLSLSSSSSLSALR
jgi:hypothetical protein